MNIPTSAGDFFPKVYFRFHIRLIYLIDELQGVLLIWFPIKLNQSGKNLLSSQIVSIWKMKSK